MRKNKKELLDGTSMSRWKNKVRWRAGSTSKALATKAIAAILGTMTLITPKIKLLAMGARFHTCAIAGLIPKKEQVPGMNYAWGTHVGGKGKLGSSSYADGPRSPSKGNLKGFPEHPGP
eukprot:5996866-Heterocapsa_arctica.AAC.1